MTHGADSVTVVTSSFKADGDTDEKKSSGGWPVWVIAVVAVAAVLIVVGLLLLWLKLRQAGKKRVDPVDRWATNPPHHRLDSAKVKNRQTVNEPKTFSFVFISVFVIESRRDLQKTYT